MRERCLRASLESRGYRFRTSSDTEVLLRLYEAEPDQCTNRLDGMFAFAVWDGRRNRLLLARDRVGKKPLFYYASPTMVAFASEIKALLRHPEIDARTDTEALPAFFLYGYVPTPGTLYHGIRKLPPGCQLSIGPGGQTRLEEYWDVPFDVGSASRAPSQAQAMAEVRTLLTDAVRRR
ncbi:MAG: asparagine synthetase B, partial [Candidatus Omnitrophica bacterium]|nr:asparagine synthetase B [Candidatus Omnitrophota bacterium]